MSKSDFRLTLISDPPGVIEVPELENTIICMHVGRSSSVACRRAGYRHRGIAVHGDIDIIPSGTPSLWELQDRDTVLVLSLSPRFLKSVAEELDFEASRLQIRNRFQIRDPQLEHVALALKAEMDSGSPSGRMYLDSLAVSAAVRLVRAHSSLSGPPQKQNGKLTDRRLRQAVSYIEDNLAQEVSLADIAAATGLSVSHFKSLFRESMGLPVHQYVIRRRVDRAKRLLIEGRLSISQVAQEAGFAHQSHLARHVRRVLGVSPRDIQEERATPLSD